LLAARRGVLDALLGAVVFFCVLGAAFHTPAPPVTGVDPSWMVALGQAARDHFAFGRDVIYTYGPLGYLEVPGAVPYTYAAKTLFALSIACACGILVLLRARSEGTPWQRIGFVLGALIVFPYTNALYIVGEGDLQIFLLLVLLFTFPAFSQAKPMRLFALLLGVFAGFASLVKFSLYIFSLIVGLGIFVARALDRRRSPELRRADVEAATLYVVGFAASSTGIYYWVTFGLCYQTALATLGLAGAFCWVAWSGGKRSFLGFPIVPTCTLIAIVCSALAAASAPYREFLYYSLQVAAGYSSATSREAHSHALPIGLVFLGMASLLAIRETAALGRARVFAILAILLVAFKQAFVRQDAVHLIPYFLTVSFVGCVLLLSAAQPRSAVYAAFLVVLSLPALPAFANYGPTKVRDVTFPVAVGEGLRDAFQAISGWRSNAGMLDAHYKLGLAPDSLAPPIRRKLGNDPVDLVGTETAIVFANDLPWKPRPAFHAPYSVFAPSLDALNRDSIRSGKTGRELLTYETIDKRYAFGDEPMTSRELICNYAADPAFPSLVKTRGGDVLAVLRRAAGRCGLPTLNQSGAIGWDEPLTVRVPPGRLAFLFIDFRYSLFGRVLRSLYQIPPVRIVVRYRDGSTANYRVLPELLGGGLLVNPIPQSMEDVRTLFAGRNSNPVDVVQFTVQNSWLFSPSMQYRLEEVPYRT
jgi:hypothetical protein